MNKDNKRYRQISISESFANSKKSKNNCDTASMEQNLRDLLAAAAEKRITSSTTKNDIICSDSQQPTTSKLLQEDNDEEAPSSEDIFVPSSQELFPDSEDFFSSQTVTEVPPTPDWDLVVNDISSVSTSSREIFSEVDAASSTEMEDKSDSEEELTQVSFLNRIPGCSLPLPKLEPLENHFIMFSPHIRPGSAPRPYPSSYRDKWDFYHVRMPCSPQNKFPIEDVYGEKQIRSRWELICRSLSRNIESSEQLEAAIMQYNSQYRNKWNFHSLHAFFNQCLSEEEKEHFFETILPVMINMALDLPNICTQPPPLLKKNKDHSVTMSQKQVGCLLLNAFFCTFPRRNYYSKYRRDLNTNEYSSYPDINFNRLFSGVKNKISSKTAEKLKCLINYFRRITEKEPVGTITFHRQFLKNLPTWRDSSKSLKATVIKSNGVIEVDGDGMLQVDFANKFVGGGVLGHGCVQEEIRFVICPELIVSRLFVECLGPTEVLIITGSEQYNTYSGYSDNFKWEGNFQDRTPRDSWGRRCTQIVAMDATDFNNTYEQYKPYRIERELNKAFCGFYEETRPPNLSAIATGNWGCGAFNGNPVLKFMIQLMAASQANRDILYFTFGDKTLKHQLMKLYNILTEKNIVVGDVWRILTKYINFAKLVNREPFPSLFDFVCSILNDETDSEEVDDTNTEEIEIGSIDQLALEKLITDVEKDSNTETEDDVDSKINDPG